MLNDFLLSFDLVPTIPKLAVARSVTMQEEGNTIEDFHQRVDRDYFPTFRAGLLYWLLMGIINFK